MAKNLAIRLVDGFFLFECLPTTWENTSIWLYCWAVRKASSPLPEINKYRIADEKSLIFMKCLSKTSTINTGFTENDSLVLFCLTRQPSWLPLASEFGQPLRWPGQLDLRLPVRGGLRSRHLRQLHTALSRRHSPSEFLWTFLVAALVELNLFCL